MGHNKGTVWVENYYLLAIIRCQDAKIKGRKHEFLQEKRFIITKLQSNKPRGGIFSSCELCVLFHKYVCVMKSSF